LINPISAVFEKIFCGQRSQETSVEGSSIETGKPLPGSDTVEASRRRYKSYKLLHLDLFNVTSKMHVNIIGVLLCPDNQCSSVA